MSTGANTGSTGAATCSTAADLGSTGTSKGSNVAVSSHFLKNVEKCQFYRGTLTYDVFGPIILDYAPGDFFAGIFTLGEEAAF